MRVLNFIAVPFPKFRTEYGIKLADVVSLIKVSNLDVVEGGHLDRLLEAKRRSFEFLSHTA